MTIRTSPAVAALAGLAVAATMAVATPADAVPVEHSSVSTAVQIAKFSDADIFRSVFFGTGPLSPALAKYFDGSQSATDQAREAENEVMADLETRAPGAIAEFADAVRSGSHVRTLAALDRIVESMSSLISDVDSGKKEFSGQCAALAAAVVVALAVWIVVVIPFTDPGGMEQVKKDELVDDVITAYANA